MQDVSEKLAAVEARSKSNSHRLDKLESQTEAMNRLATSVEVMAVEQKNMSGQLTEVVADVKEMNAEPGKRWNFAVEKAIYLVVAAIAGGILARIGLG